MTQHKVEQQFDHPCRETCSGWQQGYEKGYESRDAEITTLNSRLEKLKKALEYYSFQENHGTQRIFNEQQRQDISGSAVMFCDESGKRARQALAEDER